MLGSGVDSPYTLTRQSEEVQEVRAVSSDAKLFTFGFFTDGMLRRAYVQGGAFLESDGATIARASTYSSFDQRVERGAGGCIRVTAKEAAGLGAPPYTVGVKADEVYLGNERVAFVVQDEVTRFPQGEDLGPGCELEEEPEPDAGHGSGEEPEPSSQDGGMRIIPPPPPDSGCACRTASLSWSRPFDGSSRNNGGMWQWLLGLMAMVYGRRTWLRRR